jgi:hypothetical protein
MSAEGYVHAAGVGESVTVPEVGASDVENEAAGPGVGITEVDIDVAGPEDVAEELNDGEAEADSNMGRGKSSFTILFTPV